MGVRRRLHPCEVEHRRGDIDHAHQGFVDKALCSFGMTNDHGYPQAWFVDGRLGSGKGDAMICEVDDEGLFVDAGLFEDFDETAYPLIDARDVLVLTPYALGRTAP